MLEALIVGALIIAPCLIIVFGNGSSIYESEGFRRRRALKGAGKVKLLGIYAMIFHRPDKIEELCGKEVRKFLCEHNTEFKQEMAQWCNQIESETRAHQSPKMECRRKVAFFLDQHELSAIVMQKPADVRRTYSEKINPNFTKWAEAEVEKGTATSEDQFTLLVSLLAKRDSWNKALLLLCWSRVAFLDDLAIGWSRAYLELIRYRPFDQSFSEKIFQFILEEEGSLDFHGYEGALNKLLSAWVKEIREVILRAESQSAIDEIIKTFAEAKSG